MEYNNLECNDEVICGRNGNYLVGRILYFYRRSPVVAFNKKYKLRKSSYRIPRELVKFKCEGMEPKKSIITLKFLKNNICGG